MANFSANYVYVMQKARFETFKSQDIEKGEYDLEFVIEGKKLYAHRFTIIPVSETLNAMLSNRWSNKNEPIKIESYSYDNFYQFLCFNYIGRCELTNENIREMVDMAEFYGVTWLKNYCDIFLSKMEFTVENIEEINFITFKKPFVQFFSGALNGNFRSEFFEAAYKWVEQRVMEDSSFSTKENITDEITFKWVYELAEKQTLKKQVIASKNGETLNIVDSNKADLAEVLPILKFHNLKNEFLMDFVAEKGFLLSPVGLYQIYKEKRMFQFVCELAEKQALQKQKISSDPDNFNLAETIKADLAKVISYVNFFGMDKKFLNKFLVPNGILSQEEVNRVNETRVEVRNGSESITGVFTDDYSIRFKFLRLGQDYSKRTKSKKIRYYKIKIPIPNEPSGVLKMKGVEWYLCLEKDGVFTVKHQSIIDRSDYLLAQMENNDEFQLYSEERTYVRVSFSKNV